MIIKYDIWHFSKYLVFELDQKWNDFYRISELMLATLIQRYDKKSFHFKNVKLIEILQVVNCHILWLS